MEMKTVRSRAAKATKSLYTYTLKYRRIPTPKLPLLDAHFYDTSRDELIEKGFLLLGDVRDTGAPRGSLVYKTPMRILVEPDGRTTATIALLQNSVEERLNNALSGMSIEGTIDQLVIDDVDEPRGRADA